MKKITFEIKSRRGQGPAERTGWKVNEWVAIDRRDLRECNIGMVWAATDLRTGFKLGGYLGTKAEAVSLARHLATTYEAVPREAPEFIDTLKAAREEWERDVLPTL